MQSCKNAKSRVERLTRQRDAAQIVVSEARSHLEAVEEKLKRMDEKVDEAKGVLTQLELAQQAAASVAHAVSAPVASRPMGFSMSSASGVAMAIASLARSLPETQEESGTTRRARVNRAPKAKRLRLVGKHPPVDGEHADAELDSGFDDGSSLSSGSGSAGFLSSASGPRPAGAPAPAMPPSEGFVVPELFHQFMDLARRLAKEIPESATFALCPDPVRQEVAAVAAAAAAMPSGGGPSSAAAPAAPVVPTPTVTTDVEERLTEVTPGIGENAPAASSNAVVGNQVSAGSASTNVVLGAGADVLAAGSTQPSQPRV